ncbi:MAG TPA: MarR family transcriptional regulator [Frankiaceae bacterium]|nr:MarR family transcriptional regulator [Frankiaceae bacterium]
MEVAGGRRGDGRSAGARTVGAGMVDARGMRAWRAFLRAHSLVLRALEAELEAAHELPLASYDVLVQLAEAPERRLRMSDLADAVLLSRSGLTRLVDRLEREGLVARQSCPSDARGTLAALTPAGLARLRRAAGTHLRGVARHFTSPYTSAELDALADLLGRLAPPDPVPPARACGQG